MRVFLKLCELNFKKLLIYRASFYISMILMTMWVGAYVVLIEVIFYYTPLLAGWTKGEVIIILAFYYLIQNVSDIFFKDNVEDFGRTVRRGELDFRIIKPASLRVLSFFWEIRFDQIAGVVVTGFLFSYGIHNLSYSISLLHFLIGTIITIFSIIFYYSLLTIIAALTFWIEKTDTFNVLIFNISQLARYPRSIYTSLFGKFLTFGLPIALIASVPAEIALKGIEPAIIGVLIAGSMAFYILSRIIWYYGLRRYTSAN